MNDIELKESCLAILRSATKCYKQLRDKSCQNRERTVGKAIGHLEAFAAISKSANLHESAYDVFRDLCELLKPFIEEKHQYFSIEKKKDSEVKKPQQPEAKSKEEAIKISMEPASEIPLWERKDLGNHKQHVFGKIKKTLTESGLSEKEAFDRTLLVYKKDAPISELIAKAMEVTVP